MSLFLKFLSILLSANLVAVQKPNNSRKEVMNVIHKYSQKIKKENNIILRCDGLDYAGKDKIYDGKIHTIGLSYSIDKRINYIAGRTLFYSILDGLISKLNQEESFKNHFHNHPVGYESFRFTLSFDYEDKKILKKDDLYMISILENEITYFFMKQDGQGPKMETKEITPGLYRQNIDLNLRSITRKLPEDPEMAKQDR